MLDLLLLLVWGLDWFYEKSPLSIPVIMPMFAALLAIGGFVGGRLGQFLKVSQHSSTLATVLLRFSTRSFIYVAGLLLPALLLLAYLHLAAWGIAGLEHVPRPFEGVVGWYWWAFLPLVISVFFFKPNAYSLHKFYRDRLSKAFLFNPDKFDSAADQRDPRRYGPLAQNIEKAWITLAPLSTFIMSQGIAGVP